MEKSEEITGGRDGITMIKLTITESQSNQRLDRFLKKYFDGAPLSHIYKMIRKDVKVNGRRKGKETILSTGDEITIFIREEEALRLQKPVKRVRVKKQFAIAYEDANILAAVKPFGLLTHGDRNEKKNHLTNQVIDYLIEKGDYDPRDKTFVPASAGRLDRNTTGLVLFGKNRLALQQLNQMNRTKQSIGKYYLTIVEGKIKAPLHLRDKMTKDPEKNQIQVLPLQEEGKLMETIATPLAAALYSGHWYTLTQVEILTGRTHQIRAQLANAGFPVIGDRKYGRTAVNHIMERDFGLTTHLLHGWKLEFRPLLQTENEDNGQEGTEKGEAGESKTDRRVDILDYLRGRVITAELPSEFRRIKETLFGKNEIDIGDKRE